MVGSTSTPAKMLQKKGFKIVMWDILSYDYDTTLSPEKCLRNVLQYIKPGSIIVFHDSLKAEKKTFGMLYQKYWQILKKEDMPA